MRVNKTVAPSTPRHIIECALSFMTRLRSSVFGLAFVVLACNERSPMTPNKRFAPEPRFAVTTDAELASLLTEQNEHAQEQLAIEAILQRTPADKREVMRAALKQNGRFVGSDDPDMARLLSRLQTIRDK